MLFRSSQQDSRQLSIHISESRAATPSEKILSATDKTTVHKSDIRHEPQLKDPSQSRKKQTEPHKQNFNQLAQAKIMGHIRKKMVQNFIYPRLARRQGWQGQVLLGFQVNHAGSIQHIHVKQSSGYAILDNSAITALNKIGKVADNESGFTKQNWQFEIPIIYRLEG